MNIEYKKNARKWFGVLCTIAIYYLLHEGAHFVYAKMLGVFKQIRFMGLGIRIETYTDNMTAIQLGIFCVLGAAVTIPVGWCLSAFTAKITESKSAVLKAVLYYLTLGMLLIDPLYLSVLCSFFGGGDMNGIVSGFGISEMAARLIFGGILLVNGCIFLKYVTPKYKESFR